MPKQIYTLAFVALALIVLTACKSDGETTAAEPSVATSPRMLDISSPPEPSPRIDTIDLWTNVTPINLDDKPGAEGAQLQIRFFRLDTPTAVALDRGWVEVVYFDGRVAPTALANTEPFYVSAFTADQLRAMRSKTIVGWSHGMTVPWGKKPPQEGIVTLTVRLLRPGKRSLYAKPVYLSNKPR